MQYLVAIFPPQTKGAWTLRFDDMIADALKFGPLRQAGPDLFSALLEKLQAATSSGIPFEIIQTLAAYYIANRPEDSDWAVLPVVNFDACFGILFDNSLQFKITGANRCLSRHISIFTALMWLRLVSW